MNNLYEPYNLYQQQPTYNNPLFSKAQPPHTEVIKVNGKNGAEAF